MRDKVLFLTQKVVKNSFGKKRTICCSFEDSSTRGKYEDLDGQHNTANTIKKSAHITFHLYSTQQKPVKSFHLLIEEHTVKTETKY